MASPVGEKIRIPFCPLLVQITDCLDFPKPTYSVVDAAKCSACVYIRTEGERGIFWFNGGEAASIDISKDTAAQRAVTFLINKYGICVGDFTMDRIRMYEKCGKLYKLKRNSMESADKRNACDKRLADGIVHVTLDYVAFLARVIKKTRLLVTGIETVYSARQGYLSWLTVTCSHTRNAMECFFSELCPDSNKAKQMVAKRAAYYIIHQFKLDVVDANYGAINLKGVLCSLERESCLALEERKKCQKHNAQLMPFLIEKVPATPPKDDTEEDGTVPGPSTPSTLACKRPIRTP